MSDFGDVIIRSGDRTDGNQKDREEMAMVQERRGSHLIEVGSGIWRFTDGKEMERRVRKELAELYRRNLEHWKCIQLGSPAEWQEMEKLIQRLESDQG